MPAAASEQAAATARVVARINVLLGRGVRERDSTTQRRTNLAGRQRPTAVRADTGRNRGGSPQFLAWPAPGGDAQRQQCPPPLADNSIYAPRAATGDPHAETKRSGSFSTVFPR